MQRLNRSFKWPHREPEREYPTGLRDRRPLDYSTNKMSLPGRRYAYRPFGGEDPTTYFENERYSESPKIPYTGPPPGAVNVRSFTLPHRRGRKGQEPIWIVPPKKEPRFVTMEVKEPDPEPILVIPPPPPKQKVIEYEVPVPPKPQKPILVEMMPPPPEPEYMTVRQIVEEPQSKVPLPGPMPMPPMQHRPGPVVSRLPDKRERETLLGVPRTILWELVLASFVLFIIMLLVAVFVAGFLS